MFSPVFHIHTHTPCPAISMVSSCHIPRPHRTLTDTHTCPALPSSPPALHTHPFLPVTQHTHPACPHARSRILSTPAPFRDSPCSGHPQGGRFRSSRSVGRQACLYSFPSPNRDTQTRGNTPAPKGHITHPSRTPWPRRDPRPSSVTPPHTTRTLTTPSPPAPLIADKALSPRGFSDKRKGSVRVPSSSRRTAPPLPGALAPASQGWGGG